MRFLILPMTAAAAMAPALAIAQTISTGGAAPSGVSQEQALALTARLDALERRNDELEKEVARLKTQVGAPAPAPQPTAPAPASDAVASIAGGRPTIASRDGRFRASFRGVFQMDAAHYDQDEPGPLATDFRRGSVGDATEADHARDLNDGTNFRRARLGVEGVAFGNWNYSFLYDFGGSGIEEGGKINTAWVEYAGLPVRIRIGALAPPAGMEDATSTNASLFIERAAPSELVRGIAAGDARSAVALLANGERWNASAVVSGNTVGVQTFDEQLGFVGRLAWLPVKGRDGLIHLGVNTTIVARPAATGPDVAPGVATTLRLRERPEMRVDGTRLVDTGSIDSSGLTQWGLELAAQLRNFSLQSEYMDIHLRRRASGLQNPDFSGWYAQGAWTITGEPRRYQIATAAFDAPRVAHEFNPKTGDWGAWELVGRYSDLDLNYLAGNAGSAADASAVRGGEQQIWTLGLNWYPNATVRFQADYQHVDVNRLSAGGTTFGAGVLTPPAGAQIGQTFSIWSLRTQYAF
jgi:phosphate-selective porin OprO/OprP